MKAVHFGAGNIGRGFIGEVLCKNGFHVTFVDVNETLIDELQKRGGYEIELAGEDRTRQKITNVDGINSKKNPEQVAGAIAEADLVTTAIGPQILAFIAESIAKGISGRQRTGNKRPLDVIACENMIGGSAFLRSEVEKYLDGDAAGFAALYIGFPNAAVDRIVPAQKHGDPLFVTVEHFREWVIDDSERKAKHVTLEGVEYVPDLLPFIERKLFSVNSGHATAAYSGHYYGHAYINEALKDKRVMTLLKNALAETGSLLVEKWGFDKTRHAEYVDKIISRFTNPAISDDIPRVARTPIRKLGREERFTRPVCELKKRGLQCKALLSTMAFALVYDNPDDAESVKLQEMLKTETPEMVIETVTALDDADLIAEIAAAYRSLKK
ncbi:MAG: mannitol-1-phosphate 5-dehydrogenase [Spirochaetaceae bacterium]|jgi:mannitol-1-phosphate 5-dehydrogenase|nr:mannitol-1-phosphate 5-dehydrogenase [Spirochaetaceae bacterium]